MARLAGAVLLSAVALCGPADAALRAASGDPGRFTDADRAGGIMTAEAATDQLVRFLERLGERLPPGSDLDIRILDIDLAGRIAPERALSPSTRIMDGTTWPRVRLSYTLKQGGRTVRSAEELVSRQDYLARPTARFAGDPLRFEKTMLAEWFANRFLHGRA